MTKSRGLPASNSCTSTLVSSSDRSLSVCVILNVSSNWHAALLGGVSERPLVSILYSLEGSLYNTINRLSFGMLLA